MVQLHVVFLLLPVKIENVALAAVLPPSSVLERTRTEVPREFFGKGDVLFKIRTSFF